MTQASVTLDSSNSHLSVVHLGVLPNYLTSELLLRDFVYGEQHLTRGAMTEDLSYQGMKCMATKNNLV